MSSKDCPQCGNPLDAAICKRCGYSNIPEWIRLWCADQASMTLRDEVTQITRDLFHSYFRHVTAPSGHPVAAYFPSDGSPLFEVSRNDDGWYVFSTCRHRNRVRLNGIELSSGKKKLEDGSKFEIVSGNDGTAVGTFVFRYK